MFARAGYLGLILAALILPVDGIAASSPRTRPPLQRQAPRDLLREALARRPSPSSLETSRPGSVSSIQSTLSSCGSWASLFDSDFGGFYAEYALMVHDPVRDRMLVFNGRYSGNNPIEVWALPLSGSPTLTLLETQSTVGEIPENLSGASAVYDPVRDRVVLCGAPFFGGQGGPALIVFELTLSGTPTWSDITPDGDYAPVRSYHSAIYDQTRDRMVIFGGQLGDGSGLPANDVWVMNFSGTPAWTQLSPGGSAMPARAVHTAVYDGPRDRMVVFGGYDADFISLNDAWALSLSGSGSWSQINTGGGSTPAPRNAHTAIVDTPRNRMIVFGGWEDSGNTPTDVWSLSFTNPIRWTQLSPTGSVSHIWDGFASAYDPAREQMVSVLGDELWTLSNLGGTPAWMELNPPGQVPVARNGAVTIYDTPRQRMLMFGGVTWRGLRANDLWSFSMVDGTWARIVFPGARPSGRYFPSAIYDPVADRMILFGGAGDAGPLNDTWQLSLAGTPTWTQLTPSGTPPPIRYAHTAILDAPRNRMIVNGGSDDTGTAKSDVWALSLAGSTSWSQLSPSGGPAPPREFHTAIFDAPRNRMLSFGWNDNSVWALSLAGSPAWSIVTAAGTAPPTMAGHQAAYDAVRDRMLVSLLDTYELTLSGTPTWGQVGSTDPVYGGRSEGASMWDTGNDRWVIFGGETFYNDVVALSFPPLFPLNLSASPTAGGAIQASPSGACELANSQVTLTAVPAAPYGFVSWSGDASGTANPITVTMDSEKTVTATFATYPVNVTVTPTASGTVTRNPNQATYPHGSQMTLTATPAVGYAFNGWSGDASGSTNPLTVTVDGPKNITASFIGYPVSITVTPTATGTVTKNPNQAVYAPGSQVTLTASNSPYPFLGWSGDASGTTNPLTITVDGPKSITASFQAFSVTTSAAPANGGSVTRSPNQSAYPPGAVVTLTAVPADGFVFASWSGDTTDTVNPLSLAVHANKNIVANFVVPPPSCGAWSLIPSGVLPSARRGTSAVWDPVRHRILVFGGYNGTNYLNEIWQLTTAGGWAPLAPAGSPPSGREVAGMVYEPAGDRLVVFGGRNNGGQLNDLWQLSLSGTPTWAPMAPTGTPPAARAWFSTIYDASRSRMVIFGGLVVGFGWVNEVWALTLSGTPSWSQLSPAGPLPPGREGHVAVYDPVRDRMLIQEGTNAQSIFSDVWALSFAGTPTWSQLSPTGQPPQRFNGSAVYDPVRDRMLVVGGQEFTISLSKTYDEVWSLSFKIQPPMWTQLRPGGVALGSRYLFSMVYEPETDALVAIAGARFFPSGIRNDAKRLDCAGGWWLEAGAINGSVQVAPTKLCFGNGEVATLLASPVGGAAFNQWLGDASGNDNPLNVTMDANKTILAEILPRTTDVEDMPVAFSFDAHPNPSVGATQIEYVLPHQARVRIAVFDLAGRVMARLVDGPQPSGRHVVTWSGTREGARLGSGVYLVRFETPAGIWTKRVALLR